MTLISPWVLPTIAGEQKWLPNLFFLVDLLNTKVKFSCHHMQGHKGSLRDQASVEAGQLSMVLKIVCDPISC